MTVNQELMSVAIHSLSLFRAPGSSAALIRAVAEVTGVPMLLLLRTERRVVQSLSLVPLKELLRNPAVPKAEGLQYKLKLKQLHAGKASAREHVATRMTMTIDTVRGRIKIDATLSLKKGLDGVQAPQVARLSICYRVESSTINQAYKQELTIASPRPEPRRVRVVNARARAA